MEGMYRLKGETVTCYLVDINDDMITYEDWFNGKLRHTTEPLNSREYKWVKSLVGVSTQVTNLKHNKLWGLK